MGKVLSDALGSTMTQTEGEDIAYSAQRAVTFTVSSNSAIQAGQDAADYQTDGTADESQINTATGGCSAYGGTVCLTENLFQIAATVEITGRVELVGQGPANTVLIAAASLGDTGIISYDSGGVTNTAIRRLKVDGNNTRGGGAGRDTRGINLTYASSAVLEDVAVIHCARECIYTESGSVYQLLRVDVSGCGEAATGVSGIHFTGVSGPQFNRVTVVDATGNGITFSGTSDIHCTDVAVDLCRVGTSGYGWTISGGNGHLTGCSVGACGAEDSISGGGLYLTAAISNLVITNFGSRNHWGDGLYDLWVAGTNMDNITISNSIFTADTTNDDYLTDGVYFGGNNTNFNFIGNVITGHDTYDLVVNSDFEGNGVIANNTWGSKRTLVAGCDFNDFAMRNNNGWVVSGDVVTIHKIIDHASLTDNGDATAYMDFDDAIPAGAVIQAIKCDFTEAFNSDDTTTLTMMIGYTGDLDAFNLTADPGENAFNHTTDVYWYTADCQAPKVATAQTPRVTFTEDDDGTDIINSANAQGGVTISITYMKA